MKKYLLLSFIIHLTAFFIIASMDKTYLSHSKKFGNGGTEKITILPKKQNVEIDLIPAAKIKSNDALVPMPKKLIKVSKSQDGYWGIGVYSSALDDVMVMYEGKTYVGTKLMEPIKGNPASKVGLEAGDVIFLIDNLPISDKNDLKGDGPRKMLLHIKRGNSIFTIQIEREWIETKPSSNP